MNTKPSISDSRVPGDCPGHESDPVSPAVNDLAAGPPALAPPSAPKPPASRYTRFLEKVYYWVLSRS